MPLDENGRLKGRTLANFDGLEDTVETPPRLPGAIEDHFYHDKLAMVRQWLRNPRWRRYHDTVLANWGDVLPADVASMRKEIEQCPVNSPQTS